MSETVHYRGVIQRIAVGKKECEKVAIRKLKDKNAKEAPYYNNKIEHLCDYWHEEYFYHPKTESLYEIVSKTNHELHEEIMSAKYIGFDNSQVGFELRYYNGGAGFRECLEEAMNKLK